MYDERNLQALADWICQKDGFTLVAHISPDGDTLGSNLALCCALQAMGKQAQVVCDQPVPYIYAFLPGAKSIALTQQARQDYHHIIAVDCADQQRMGEAQALIKVAGDTANIDHHGTNIGYAAYNLVDPQAAATSELIFALCNALQVPLDEKIATCLYTALVTDTGNFAYSSTTARTLRVAAALLETGIDIADINRRIFRTVPLSKTRLLGRALCTMELYAQGALGISCVSRQDMQDCGATSEDVEGIIDNIRDVEGVEIAMLLRESSMGNSIKISLRSKEYADVSQIACRFGGGGHIHAAGCTLEGNTLKQAKSLLLEASQAALRGE